MGLEVVLGWICRGESSGDARSEIPFDLTFALRISVT